MSKQVRFPREPYDGQRRLAESIYETCEQGGTAIFESPTGTGKSLAVLSGSLSYLSDHSYDKARALKKVQELRKKYEGRYKSC